MAVLPRFLRNPDVVLRDEEPDAGLLFHPDTGQARLLNATGMFIWRLCDGCHDVPRLVAALREAFEEVPDDGVSVQVQAFMDALMACRFVGVVEE